MKFIKLDQKSRNSLTEPRHSTRFLVATDTLDIKRHAKSSWTAFEMSLPVVGIK